MEIFKTKLRKGYIYKKYFLGICYSKREDEFLKIIAENNHNKAFDRRALDAECASFVDKNLAHITYKKNTVIENNIAFLATTFYDVGGHTELAKNVVNLLDDRYNIATFLVQKDVSYSLAPKKMKKIEQSSQVFGLESSGSESKTNIENLFLQIVKSNPKVIFSFQHMDDAISTCVLYLIKKLTDIKIIYMNHGSHYPALGFSFADLIWECMQTTHYVTKYYRKIDKCHSIGLVEEKKENIKIFSSEETQSKRKELGILDGNFFTLSGGADYKFFENNSSPYFEMIKDLLEAEPNLQHVVMTDLSIEHKAIVEKIFKGSKALSQLVFKPLSTEYPLIFQSCDVFIDSFPVSSALTQLELMKWKIPTVVKINTKNALFSFHEYLPVDYEFMFSDIAEMKQGIIKLLTSKTEQEKATKKLFQHFLQSYEGNYIKEKLINIIDNADHLEKFYDKLDESVTYQLDI